MIKEIDDDQKNNKLICFLNSFTSMSGGDTRFIEVFKRFKEFDKYVITSLAGKRVCIQNNLKAFYILTTKEQTINNLYLTYFFRILRALNLNFKLTEKDVIYSSSDFLPDILPAFFLKKKNKSVKWFFCLFLINPTIFQDYKTIYNNKNREKHCYMPDIRKFFFFTSQQLALSIGRRWADKILVLNEIDADYLIKQLGFKKSMVAIVDGGVDFKHITYLENKEKKYDAVFLARFHPQKGIFDLIKIWKKVCNYRPNAKLCIIGSGPKDLVDNFESAIQEADLSNNIVLVGAKSGDEKFLLLKSSKVFLYPSYYESFAIVIVEAMACGLPVIAYNLPVYKKIYGNHITTVRIGDINQLAMTILSLLNDGDLRIKVGAKGQEFIQKYDWLKIAQREYQLITS